MSGEDCKRKLRGRTVSGLVGVRELGKNENVNRQRQDQKLREFGRFGRSVLSD